MEGRVPGEVPPVSLPGRKAADRRPGQGIVPMRPKPPKLFFDCRYTCSFSEHCLFCPEGSNASMKLPYIRRRKRTPRKHRSSFPKKNKEEDAKALSSLPSGQSQAEKQQEETLRLSARIGRQSSRSRTLSVLPWKSHSCRLSRIPQTRASR